MNNAPSLLSTDAKCRFCKNSYKFSYQLSVSAPEQGTTAPQRPINSILELTGLPYSHFNLNACVMDLTIPDCGITDNGPMLIVRPMHRYETVFANV